MNDDLACQELVELVTDYLDGALDAETTTRFEDHLAVCQGCHELVEQWRRTVALTGELRRSDVACLDPAVRTELLEAFRRSR